MERVEDLLIYRLDGYRPDVFVTARFQDALRVRAVGLVASDVGTHVVRRKKDDAMSEALDLASPVVGGSAGLHDDGGGRLLGHEGEELSSRQTLPTGHVARPIGDPDLEDGLCHVYGDASIVRHDGLLLCLNSSDSGTSMPTESQEESISSMKLTKLAQARDGRGLCSLSRCSTDMRRSGTPTGTYATGLRGDRPMTKPGDVCPKCSGVMESGFIVDTVFLGTPVQSKWVEGEPKYSWLVPGLAVR